MSLFKVEGKDKSWSSGFEMGFGGSRFRVGGSRCGVVGFRAKGSVGYDGLQAAQCSQ